MQRVFKYRIFNRVVRITLSAALTKKQVEELLGPLTLYPEAANPEEADLEVEFAHTTGSHEVLATNPSNHSEMAHGFTLRYPKYEIAVKRIGDKLSFTVLLSRRKRNPLIEYLSRLYSMDYATITQRLSQLLFEQVLIPSEFFDPNRIPVHSSSMVAPDGRAILIGGTGGVGKTSLELELCMNRGYAFMADDISVVDTDGFVHPNLAFPKIYSYNVKGNPVLKKKVLSKCSVDDRLAWYFKYFFFGANSVRRKVSPRELFGGYANEKKKISKYYILIKEKREDIMISKIDASTAARMTIAIVKTEYSEFFNHILWHEFYCYAKGVNPIISMNDIRERWNRQLVKVFEQFETSLVFIPMGLEHRKFVQSVSDIIALP